MKSESLKIGAKSKTSRVQFLAVVQLAETVAEALAICGGSESVLVTRFNRAHRIWLQDAIGRPMFEAGASNDDIQKALTAAKAGQKAIGRPRVQPSVAIPKGQKSFTPQQVAEMLAKSGIKVVEA